VAELQVNFKGVVDRADFEGGTYSFEIAGCEVGQGPSGPYLRVALTFIDGKYAGLHTEDIVSMAQKALWRLKALLKALGYDIPDGDLRFRSEDLVGLRFKGVCSRETDPAGKYPPKLRVNEYHDLDWVEPVQPQGASAQPATAAPEGGSDVNGSATTMAPPPMPASPPVSVSKPKLKV
jgi:hypothetical protein